MAASYGNSPDSADASRDGCFEWCIQEREADPEQPSPLNVCELSVSNGCRIYEHETATIGRGDGVYGIYGDKCIIFTGIKRYQ